MSLSESSPILYSLEIRGAKLFARVQNEAKSQSHDTHHIAIVLSRAKELADWCTQQGMMTNWSSLHAACCLHDLGRNNPNLHQKDSLEASVKQASPILSECGYSEKEIQRVCDIIRQHDQPEVQPDNFEALILKEADFLAGFGAWGIFRTIAWGIESSRSTSQIIAILKEKMPARIASLRLPPAIEIAWREWPLVNLFLVQLESQKEHQKTETYPGKYIVFEGVSGSGKDTQAALLSQYFEERKIQTLIINEPSDTGRKMTRDLKTKARKSNRQISQLERALVLAADRVGIVENIKEALRFGKTVIEVRSFLSAMAYQGISQLEMARILLFNQFVLQPVLIILLDINPEEALRRTRSRGTTPGDFEKLTELRRVSENFKLAASVISSVAVKIVSANSPIEEVFESVKQIIERSKTMVC